VVNGKIVTAGDTPAVAGAATTTATVQGNDTAGTVTVTATGAATSTVASVTFASAYSQTPTVTLTPATADAANVDYYVSRTATGFDIILTSNAAAGQVLRFDYQIIQ
jgi:hypothetical protein